MSEKLGGIEHIEAVANLPALIENAEYDHYEPKDEKHPNSEGQDVYYSALNMGGKLYSVKIKLDVVTEQQRQSSELRGEELTADVIYKDHKLTEIEIAPTLYQGVTDIRKTKQEVSAISDVSLGVIRGNVKPSGINKNILYQLAYHGTPHDFDNFSLDGIGTGEGAQAHGWGLYFAKNKKVSEKYRNKLAFGYDYIFIENGKETNQEDTDFLLKVFKNETVRSNKTSIDISKETIEEKLKQLKKIKIDYSERIKYFSDLRDKIAANSTDTLTAFQKKLSKDEKNTFDTLKMTAQSRKGSKKITLEDTLSVLENEYISALQKKEQREKSELQANINKLESLKDKNFHLVNCKLKCNR